MFELSVAVPETGQRYSLAMTPGKSFILGRSPEADFTVAWDGHVSRRHARLTVGDEFVDVEKLAEAANPIMFDGREADQFRVQDTQRFVIGSTVFELSNPDSESRSPGVSPVEEVTFSRNELQKVRFHDADKRVEVLSRLPQVIWDSRSESDLQRSLVNLMLAGVAHAEAVALVDFDDERSVRVLNWERRREAAGEFHPSTRLVDDSLNKRKSSVLHVWESASPANDNYTAMAGFDWAYCTPVAADADGQWGIYVAGRMTHAFVENGTLIADGVQLQADVKFTELVAEIVSSLRLVNRLERQMSGFRQFFAPPILEALRDDPNSDLLDPRECDVTVMFCDLRGFSRHAEVAADDLIGLLDRVSRALGVMTHFILEHGGVTGDFQGDAALGFWGWPIASEDAPLDACRAALRIRAAFEETTGKPGHPLADFRMGIGIAHGRAVAGKIGTADQVKVTVFGPVVNLASRLESLTKQLRVPILLDESTAEIVRQRLDRSEARTRRLAKVLPYGTETPVTVSELLPPESEWPELTDAHLEQYEIGVEHFIAGRWEEAYHCLHQMPAGDRAQDFLAMLIAQHNRVAASDWDGIVRFPSK